MIFAFSALRVYARVVASFIRSRILSRW
jgi:hypothetical protein